MAKTRKQWNIRQKISAVTLIHEIGVKPAARQLGMPISSLRRWRKDETKLVELDDDAEDDEYPDNGHADCAGDGFTI